MDCKRLVRNAPDADCIHADKESISGPAGASKLQEESERGCEAGESSRQPELEEILQ